MTQKSFYITTPLYYVNAKPHIGHAYTNILCDTFARWHRMLGEKVFFLTGTDEHGTKIEKAAREQGKEPRAYTDEMVPEFKKLWQRLGIEYDYFIRTTDADHRQTVQNILKGLEARGEIYKADYKGWYCTPCESFWTKLQLNGGAGLKPAPTGARRVCPDCGRDVQELSEENYFFKLSKYQKWLVEYIESHPEFVRPEMRKNEILGFLREPLEDLCISRPRARLAWGIDYPSSKEHVVYVWFDALINYVTAAGYGNEKKFKTLWPADIHMVGKDILRHHAVYWPMMLKAIGVEMPKTVLAHGWWTLQGTKVSKSRGNAVDPTELCKKYGVDAFRYFLLNEVTIGNDGAFSEDLLAERYASDLANNLGNLWFRLASMLEKYFEGKIPRTGKSPVNAGAAHASNAGGRHAPPLQAETYALWEKVDRSMKNLDPREALSHIWNVAVRANQYIEETKPWVLAKDAAKKEVLAETLLVLAECVAHLGILLRPFLPETAEKILERLQLDVGARHTPNVGARHASPLLCSTEKDFTRPLLKAGTAVERGEALFPRLEEIR